MRATEQFKKNIIGLIEATKSKKIEWKKQNSTTFYFFGKTSKNDSTLVSIQSVYDGYNQQEDVRLTITNQVSKEVILSLDTDIQELSGLISELYEEVTFSIEKRGVDYFDDLLSNL